MLWRLGKPKSAPKCGRPDGGGRSDLDRPQYRYYLKAATMRRSVRDGRGMNLELVGWCDGGSVGTKGATSREAGWIGLHLFCSRPL